MPGLEVLGDCHQQWLPCPQLPSFLTIKQGTDYFSGFALAVKESHAWKPAHCELNQPIPPWKGTQSYVLLAPWRVLQVPISPLGCSPGQESL